MIKNKLKYLIGIIVVVILVSIVNISYKSIKPYAIDNHTTNLYILIGLFYLSSILKPRSCFFLILLESNHTRL
jgi:uncharacterized membrane protein